MLFTFAGDDGDEGIKLPVVMLRASDGAALLAMAAGGGDGGGEQTITIQYSQRRLSPDDADDEPLFKDAGPARKRGSKPTPASSGATEAHAATATAAAAAAAGPTAPPRWCRKCKAEFTGERCEKGHANFMYAKSRPAGA
eukprot:SAG22_NODE_717_length_7707_cov_3.098186_5_plen_140_part_00